MTGLPYVSTGGTGAPTTSWYMITTDQMEIFKGIIAGTKTRINVIILIQTFFCVGNCANTFNLFASGIRGGLLPEK